jgi:chromosome segregation ATPase
MNQQDPSREETLDAAPADLEGTRIGPPEALREDHLQRLRAKEPAAELELLRGALEELEAENLELLKNRQRSQERVVDLRAALTQTQHERDAAETQARYAAEAIEAMKASVSWRITTPLRLAATAARRLRGRAVQPR